jgi:hypothetical protein
MEPDRWPGSKDKKGPGKFPGRNYNEILKSAGITRGSVTTGDDGMWIQMWK